MLHIVGSQFPTGITGQYRDPTSIFSSQYVLIDTLKMGRIGYPETSVTNFQLTLRNDPEAGRPHGWIICFLSGQNYKQESHANLIMSCYIGTAN